MAKKGKVEERFYFRMTTDNKKLISLATTASGSRNMSEFVRNASIDKAVQVLGAKAK